MISILLPGIHCVAIKCAWLYIYGKFVSIATKGRLLIKLGNGQVRSMSRFFGSLNYLKVSPAIIRFGSTEPFSNE